MKFEFSAGGVVFREQEGNIAVIVCKPTGRESWVFPKGLIGDHHKNEGKEATAVREVEEEAGVKAKIISPLSPVTYWYQQEGEKCKKTVYYYLMEYVSGDCSQHDWEMSEVQWVAWEEVGAMLSYTSDKKVWEEAKKQLKEVIMQLM